MGAKQSRPLPTRPFVPGIPNEFQELHALCQPVQEPTQAPNVALTFRLPVGATPEHAMTVVGDLLLNNNQDWIRTLEIIQKILDNSTTFSLDWFKLNSGPPYTPPYPLSPRYFHLVAMTAVFFDRECSTKRTLIDVERNLKPMPPQVHAHEFWKRRPPYRWVRDGILPLFEHMLLVDYGFESQPLEFRKWDDKKEEWTRSVHLIQTLVDRVIMPELYAFCRDLFELVNHWRTEASPRDHPEMICSSSVRITPPNSSPYTDTNDSPMDFDFSAQHHAEAFLMLYWFHTRRREISEAEYEEKRTGYTGIIQEMLAEAEDGKPARLKRKLLVDIHYLIPTYVRGKKRRGEVLKAAQDLAANSDITTALVKKSRRVTVTKKFTKPSEDLGTWKDPVNPAEEQGPPPTYKEAIGGKR